LKLKIKETPRFSKFKLFKNKTTKSKGGPDEK